MWRGRGGSNNCIYWDGISGWGVYIVYRDTLLFFCLCVYLCVRVVASPATPCSFSIEFLVEIRISKWRTSNVIMESIV